MSIARAEELKRDLTNKYVVVREGVAELRRFVGLTGRVKTVNMSCRALVQFDGPVDISWYDIDPAYLTVVDQPLPKKATEKEAKHEKPAAAPKAAPAAAGKSPLELARQQGAGGAKGPSPLELARQQGAAGKAAEGGEKKLSPLELARQQGAAGAKPAAPAGEKRLSPLELARQQGAAKSAPAATPATPPPAPAPETASAPVAEVPKSAPAAKPGSTAEILALARQQGAFKG